VEEVLRNPRYAGAYAFGRRTQKLLTRAGKPVSVKLPREKWFAFVPNIHEGYITLEEFEANQRRLEENSGRKRWRYAPREGPALLQGLAVCGHCGSRMSVRYHFRRGEVNPDYVCQGPHRGRGEPVCQSIPGDSVDEFVGKLLLEIMKPVGIEVALAVQVELETRAEEADKLRYRGVERAQYEVDLARRRFMQVDPDNRLVADQLEAEWNTSLRALRVAREEYERGQEQDRLALDDEKKARIRALVSDFPALWKNPKTPSRERKRMVRLVIEDVTLLKEEEISLNARFKGGAVRSFLIPRLRSAWEERTTSPEVVAEVDRLLDNHTYGEIADILNERGLVSGCGNRFDGHRVKVIKKLYGLKDREARLREAGYLKLPDAARRLGICKSEVKKWRRRGRLSVESRKLNDMGEYMYKDPDWKDD
jgi:hypothetical protein